MENSTVSRVAYTGGEYLKHFMVYEAHDPGTWHMFFVQGAKKP